MKIAMIMLAAGNSRRFGANKLLYEIDGIPMYRHVLEQLDDTKKKIENIYSEYSDITEDNNNDNNDNNDFGRNRPSFLPRKPKFLDNTDEDDENEEQDASENQGGLSVSRGRGKKSKGDSLSYLAAGFLKMSPIAKLILLVVITLIPLMIFFMAMSPLLVFNSTSAIGIADNNDSYKASKAEKKFQERIKEVQDEYSEDGKSFEAKYIGAVYTILSNLSLIHI